MLKIFNKNISKSTIIWLIKKECFWSEEQKIQTFIGENIKLARINWCVYNKKKD